MPPSSTVTSFSRDTHARATSPPDRGRAGEQDLVHRRLRERHADLGAAVHDPHESLGQVGARQHPRDPLTRQTRPPGGLERDAVAGQQRPRDLAERLREGRAAGADHPDDAVGLVGDARALGERHRAVDPHPPAAQHLRPVLGDPDQRVDRRQQLERRDLRARPALLAGQPLLQLVEVVDHRLGHPAHVPGPVLHPQQRPQRLHLGHVARPPRRSPPAA